MSPCGAEGGCGPTGRDVAPDAAPAGRPAFEDEALAPAVDRPLLAALARGELAEGQARAVYRLVAAFKSWSDAHAEAVAEAFRGRPAGG